MKSYLFRLLDIKYGEGSRVALLLTMGFSMGMFLATLTVASTSLFLNEFKDEATWLPIAFLIAGAIGFITTSLYNFFQNRVPFIWLALVSLSVVTLLTGFLEFGADYFEDTKSLYFIGFTLIIPFSFLTYLIFWGSFGRLFNARQSKRLLGIVDVGAMLASFVAYFSIPQILKINSFSEVNLYGLSLFSIIVFVLLFVFLSTRYLTKARSFKEEKSYYKKIGFREFFGNRYMLYLASFVIISMLVVNFIDYSYLNTITSFLPEKSIAEFIAYFEMTIVIFNFLVQSFATDRIVNEYGMKVAMLVNPILIGIFTISALAVGEIINTTNAIFFVSIAMSKLFMASLKDALDNQTFRLYLLPIDSRLRIDAQTKIEGMVTAFGMFVAGSLIILIKRIEIFNDTLYITLFTVPLVLGWLFITFRMHRGYEETLHLALKKNKQDHNTSQQEKGYTLSEVLENGIKSEREDKVLYALRLMETLEPILFENSIIRLIGSDSPKIKSFAEEKMKSLQLDSDLFQTEIKKLASQAYDESEDSDALSVDPDKLLKLSKSVKQSDRVLCAKLLRKNISSKTIFILLELLRDNNPSVRFEALFTARKVKRPETWSILIELLGSTTFSHHAAAALKDAGETILPTLETAFHRSGQRDMVMLRIVQIMGRIGGSYALNLLWRKVEFPDKRIVKQIFHSLRYIQYQAEGKEARDVFNLLDTEMAKTIWNLAAWEELPATENYQYVKEALQEEININYDQIIMLLSILYDPQSIQLVQENINTGDADSIAFALELLDIFVDPQLKSKLVPLFDDSPIQEKLRNLQLHFPRENYNPIQVINYILNRDFNQNNRWTKACAIHAAAYIPEFRISRGLISQVFNHDNLLQETAAWVIYNKDKEAYWSIADRLPKKDKKFLDSAIENNRVLNGLNDGFFLGIEMILAIKNILLFKDIYGVYLSDLADRITPIDMKSGEILNIKEESSNNPIYIVAFGKIALYPKDHEKIELSRYEVLGELFQEEKIPSILSIEALERSVIFKIEVKDFYFVMANHHELVQGLIKNITDSKNNLEINNNISVNP